MDKIDLQQMRDDLEKGVLIAKMKWEQLLSYAIELEATVQRMTAAAYDDAEQVSALESELTSQLAPSAGAVPAMTDEQIAAMLEKAAYETDDHLDGLPAEPTSEYVAGYFYRRILAALPQQAAPAIPDGWKPMPIEPTHAMISAMSTSKARDDEGEFPLLLDLLDFSGENKTHTVLKAAYDAAIAAAPQPPAPEGEVK